MLNLMGFIDINIVKEKFGELVEKNASWLEIISEVTSECSTQGKLKFKSFFLFL